MCNYDFEILHYNESENLTPELFDAQEDGDSDIYLFLFQIIVQ